MNRTNKNREEWNRLNKNRKECNRMNMNKGKGKERIRVEMNETE